MSFPPPPLSWILLEHDWLFSNLYDDDRPEVGTLLRELGGFVGEGVTEHTYYVLLPAIHSLLKVPFTAGSGTRCHWACSLKAFPEECAKCEIRIGPLCMALTLKFSGDPIIPSQVNHFTQSLPLSLPLTLAWTLQAADVVKLLGRCEGSRAAILGRAVPTALSVLRARSDAVPIHLPAVCIHLLTALVQGVRSPLPDQFIQAGHPSSDCDRKEAEWKDC